EPIICK
nr:NADP-specific isocitrate dehydrogenase peptide II [swine, heart, Peptide Partial, 6 aa] [Sus scrofa]